jgi:amidophosphoribosyltransferase
MCGICGYIITNKKQGKIAKKTMSNLLFYSQKRGKDATGISFIHKGKILCIKDGKDAKKFTQSKKYKNIIQKYNPNIIIGHTRAKTQGDEKDNNNNHPLISGNMAIVHNGVIYNEDDVFKQFKLQRKGEVDSEAIVRLIDHFKQKKSDITRVAIQCACKELRGNMAIAVINAKNDRELHLVCSGNPIVLAYQKSTGTIFFASEKNILQNALLDWKTYHNFFYESKNSNDFIYRELVENEGIRITAEKTSQYIVERYVYDYLANRETKIWGKDEKKTIQQKLLPEAKEKKEKEYIQDYDKRDCIKKPSNYYTDDLIDRLALLEETPITKRTLNEDNEIKRLINTLNYRAKKHDYISCYDSREPIRHPEYYTLDQMEERIIELETAQDNRVDTPEELQEYEELYKYYLERAEKEDIDAGKELEKETEKQYEKKANKTKEPISEDMKKVTEAEILYATHNTDCIVGAKTAQAKNDYYNSYYSEYYD